MSANQGAGSALSRTRGQASEFEADADFWQFKAEQWMKEAHDSWLVVSNIFYFHPYLRKWSNLTNIFQLGWNHQLDSIRKVRFVEDKRG